MFSNLEWKVVNQDGEEVDDPVLELLDSPNVTQSGKEFIRQGKLQFELYQNQFIFGNKGGINSSLVLPDAMWNLPPEYVKMNLSGKIFRQTDINEIIEKYILELNKIKEKY